MESAFRNQLAGESSLYLQQHAHNPVDWYPWSDEAWERAKKENKLVLISIGYSSCHWCHVMERETFLDVNAARIMNENFICIKVDREERPDIDQVYMTAVQLMTGQGGWPLNCFTLPDGRPVYGGTYFPKISFEDVLIKLKDFYRDNPERANQYAGELTEGIQQSEIISVTKVKSEFSEASLQKAIDNWKLALDTMEGGPARVPKFPLPGNYRFLLRYAEKNNDQILLDHVNLTLRKMAFGGIYDQLAGGFARYSTDSFWKVPHFEKMLYDNAQLAGLYSSAYKLTQNELYKQIAIETIDFLKDEMSDGNGGYYSAFDADSEGEEGKYYVWTKEELKEINFPVCGKHDGFKIFSEYFNVNDAGYWEKNNYILLRKFTDEEFALKLDLTVVELKSFIKESKSILRKIRAERIPPVLDKKVITSWNALHISALCDAYQAFGVEAHRTEAVKCATQIFKNAITKDGMLMHVSIGANRILPGYLEDYAFVISALINLYQVTFDDHYLYQAKTLTDDAIKFFYDEERGFFWFTSTGSYDLIARKKEISDNVIPASNSEMANALFLLGDFFNEDKYTAISAQMLKAVEDSIVRYPSSYSNWANLLLNFTGSFKEIVIAGEKAEEYRKKLSALYLPDVIFAGAFNKNSSLMLLESRYVEGKTLVYICTNRSCKLPVESASEAVEKLRK
jgi:uncharacterized protein YyaL (SSP411 family)